jgi:hypothetical protein
LRTGVSLWLFEVKAGGGSLMVCSIDFKDIPEDRPVSRQLMHSLTDYMNSKLFNPEIEVDINKIVGLITNVR